MRIYGLVLALFLVAACDPPPLAPSPVDSDDDITIITVINTGGGNGGGNGNGDPVPNSPPFINPVGTQTNDVGDTVALVVTAVDPDGDPLDWRWDANEAPRNLTLQPTGDNSVLISGVISSSSALDGVFTVRLFASDGKAEASTVFSWIINDPNPPPTS